MSWVETNFTDSFKFKAHENNSENENMIILFKDSKIVYVCWVRACSERFADNKADL